MSEQFDKHTNVVKEAFAEAIISISNPMATANDFTAEHIFEYDGEFETFRIYKILMDNEADGEHGVAWTRWIGKDLTDLVWTFDCNTDLLWSNNNNSALFFTDLKDRYSQPKEQMEEVVTEDIPNASDPILAGIYSERCQLCGYFGGRHDADCKNK